MYSNFTLWLLEQPEETQAVITIIMLVSIPIMAWLSSIVDRREREQQ